MTLREICEALVMTDSASPFSRTVRMSKGCIKGKANDHKSMMQRPINIHVNMAREMLPFVFRYQHTEKAKKIQYDIKTERLTMETTSRSRSAFIVDAPLCLEMNS